MSSITYRKKPSECESTPILLGLGSSGCYTAGRWNKVSSGVPVLLDLDVLTVTKSRTGYRLHSHLGQFAVLE